MTKNRKISTVVGVMSGTSLDGLDLAVCEFKEAGNSYTYTLLEAETIDYSAIQKAKLMNAAQGSALELMQLHQKFGKFIGKSVADFLNKTNLKVGAVASHGHTIFHQPASGFTTQIGCGATIAATTSLTTVSDFRSLDVALNGQGAPLVPIGDQLLFGKYNACLNLGGIANISFDDQKNKRVAFDICVCNMALNYLAKIMGLAYDTNGELAKAGKINSELLNSLNSLEYYKITESKSLGYEWFEGNFLPLVAMHKNKGVEDLLATFTNHVATQITGIINSNRIKSVLVTGGGTFNTYLMDMIKQKTSSEIIIPDSKIIQFKEAIIFAFLGYLRLNEKINTLHSVTGAGHDSIGGAVYFVNPIN